MDVIKKKSSKSINKKLALAILLAIGVGLVWYFLKPSTLASFSVDRNRLTIAKVNTGQFDVKIAAIGTLVSDKVQWVTSTVDGVVTEVLVRPGEVVERGQVMAILSNPQVKQEMDELSWDIESQEAAYQAEQIKTETELLQSEYQFYKTRMSFEEAKMRFEAYVKLEASGDLSVSNLEFQQARLKKEQLTESIRIEEKQLQQLRLSLNALLDAEVAALNKLKKKYQRAKEQVEALTVRASASGIVQEMPLELGQRVNIGDMVSKLANQEDLIARLQVPEHKISKVAKGQKVQVDTRTSVINGEVFRIEPRVEGGNVSVDIRLPAELPQEARSDLSIDGEIFIAEKADAMFVRRPAFFQENQEMIVYKVDESESFAEQVKVKFGISSSTEIEIVEGLQALDRIIISEQNNFERFERIALK
ncbi:HlyD family efflux transporter periplasmic adaptor subunit [Pseudoalteromonas sp. OOF1S-7]|uniref:efflux RND transporter periplasmic adaptor subunit n=1 Tax=Pseudoalteromonas sp. OOF1S-7 TaxID=2917757 RepID=UPI001EF3E32C|nr:HlyD family efflux transporter periplasmic adaptor subunit [Pseudoalteromonas sp. OOF1S-7]MCG7534475.1 HlyD family efflux transporter periplasmic adaptor subunit [Pseudoalteromonas sp. OOF1S-7]